MTRKPKEKVNWREFLTAEEDVFIRSAEAAKTTVARAQSHFNKNFADRYRRVRDEAIKRAATNRRVP